jgi:hypothetical protein
MLTMGQEQNERMFHVHTSSIPHDVLVGAGCQVKKCLNKGKDSPFGLCVKWLQEL